MFATGIIAVGTISLCGFVNSLSKKMDINYETKECVNIITSTLSKTMCGGALIYYAIQTVRYFIALG